MLILDNLLLSPLLWIFREINETVQKEQAGEADAVTRSLSELYMKLETGAITEAEFEVAESALLDRLDEIRERTEGSDEDDEDDEDEEEDEEDEDDDEFEDDDEDDEDSDEDTDAADLSADVIDKRD
jgi:hypothetical protein